MEPAITTGDGASAAPSPGCLRGWRLVFVSPCSAGNVGACARLVKNFGLDGLHLVAPRCDLDRDEAASHMAVHAADVLAARVEHPDLAAALAGTRFSIGLSMRRGEAQRFDLEDWSPAPLLARAATPCALVIGREDSGLTTEERALCTALWSLPTSPAFPSMNAAQAAAAALGLLAAAMEDSPPSPAGTETLAAHDEVEAMLAHLRDALRAVDYERGRRVDVALDEVRRIAARAMLTRNDVQLVRGFCRRVLNATEKKGSLHG